MLSVYCFPIALRDWCFLLYTIWIRRGRRWEIRSVGCLPTVCFPLEILRLGVKLIPGSSDLFLLPSPGYLYAKLASALDWTRIHGVNLQFDIVVLHKLLDSIRRK